MMAPMASLKADSHMTLWPFPDGYLLEDRHKSRRVGGGDGGANSNAVNIGSPGVSWRKV